MTDTASAAKSALRARLITARAALSAAERAEASAAICRRLLALPQVAAARVVLGYAAFGHEVVIDDALTALAERGVGVLLPWVDGDELRIARVRDLETDVAPGWRGVREPRENRRRAARLDRVEVAVVPGIAFDRTGVRLGYGGGHFDRLLARLPDAPVVGIAYAVQVVDAVPMESHDRPVDILVTEREVIHPRT